MDYQHQNPKPRLTVYFYTSVRGRFDYGRFGGRRIQRPDVAQTQKHEKDYEDGNEAFENSSNTAGFKLLRLVGEPTQPRSGGLGNTPLILQPWKSKRAVSGPCFPPAATARQRGESQGEREKGCTSQGAFDFQQGNGQ